jgi:hypothetical protein
MAASDARPVPRKNVAFRYYFAIRKNDGTLITTWAGADSEMSVDGAAFADCTNEATEIGTSGVGYIDLTAGEMNGDSVTLKVTVTNTSALPVVVTFFPEEEGDYRANVSQFGGTTVTGRDIGASVLLSAGTGTGQISLTSGAVLLQATQTGVTIPTVTTLTNLPAITSNWLTAAGIAASALNGKGDWNVGKTGYSLTATTGLGNQTANITGNLSGSVGSVTGSVGSVTGAVGSVTGAVGSVTGSVGSVTAAVTLPSIPAGWITAAGIATGAVDADALAADAATEIAAAVASAMSAPSYSGTLATVTSSGGTFNAPVPTTSLAKHFLSLANGRTYLIDAHTASQAAFTLTEAWTTGGATPVNGDAVTTQYLSGSDFAANRTATAAAVRDVSNATPAGGSLGAAVNSAASAAGTAASEATAAAADAALAAASSLSASTDAAATLAALPANFADLTITAGDGYVTATNGGAGTPDPAMDVGTLRAAAARSATLAADAPAIDLKGAKLAITSGTGAGQTQLIRSYNTTTKVAQCGEPWLMTPDATSGYSVTFESAYPDAVHRGQLVAVGTRSATLATDAPAVDLKGTTLAVVNGTGAGQTVAVLAYNASTKVATLAADWNVTPAAGDEYTVRHELGTDYAIRRGDVAAATSTSVTFESPGPTGDLTGTDLVVNIVDGSGSGQSRRIVGYNPSTRVADVAPAWFATPAPGDRYALHSPGRVALPYDGLDAITATDAPGPATTLPNMLRQLWRDRFKRKQRNATAGVIRHFADDGTTVLLVQDATDDGTTQTQGPASAP